MKLPLFALLLCSGCLTSDGELRLYPDEAGYFASINNGEIDPDSGHHAPPDSDTEGYELGFQITYTGLAGREWYSPPRTRVAPVESMSLPDPPVDAPLTCTCQEDSGVTADPLSSAVTPPPPPEEPPADPDEDLGGFLARPSTYAWLVGGGSLALLLQRVLPVLLPLLLRLLRRQTPGPPKERA